MLATLWAAESKEGYRTGAPLGATIRSCHQEAASPRPGQVDQRHEDRGDQPERRSGAADGTGCTRRQCRHW